MSRQLTRSETDGVLAGVAGGIAQRFGIGSTLVRPAWLLSVFVGGLGIVAYVILAIVLPKGSSQVPAVRIAKERYARGEISATELERIRRDLQAAL
jgi:phage shock protein PspC (stress-responsive transcriptional regulator)